MKRIVVSVCRADGRLGRDVFPACNAVRLGLNAFSGTVAVKQFSVNGVLHQIYAVKAVNSAVGSGSLAAERVGMHPVNTEKFSAHFHESAMPRTRHIVVGIVFAHDDGRIPGKLFKRPGEGCRQSPVWCRK